MKKSFIIVMIAMLLCAIPQKVKSQESLLFYDFENWTDGINPVNWAASVTLNINMGIVPIPLKMDFGKKNSSSPYAGSFDLQISPYYFAGIPLLPNIPTFTVPGIVQLGSVRPVSVPLADIMELLGGGTNFDLETLAEAFEGLKSPGVPVRGDVSAVSAFIRYLPAAGSTDTVRIIAMTTHWNSEIQDRETVATGMITIADEASTYREISIPLARSGNNNFIADSISIIIMVGSLNANASTKLFIDNVTVIGTPSSITEKEMLQYSVYPNPTTETLNIIPVNSQLPYSAKLFDISGKLVIEKRTLANHAVLDIKDIAKGVYLLELTQNNEKYTQKIVIQ